MERREFLKVAFGFAAGAAALSAAAQAAPVMPQSDALNGKVPRQDLNAKPALATQDDLDQAHVEEVRWGRRRGWGRRRWGFRRRRFWGYRRRHRFYGHRRRFWGVRRRHWRHRWHRRFW